MKIIYLVSTNIFFGAENMTILLAKQLKSRHEIFYASPSGPIKTYLEEEGIPHLAIRKISVAEIQRLNKTIMPDVFHAVDFRASTYCALANVPFVAHLHNNPLWLKTYCVNSLAMLFFAQRAKKVVCVSNSVLDEYIFAQAIRKKTIVIENVIDPTPIYRQSEDNAKIPEYDIGFVGRLTEQKDPLRLIDIICEVNKKRKVHAVLVGDGPMQEKIIEKIHGVHMENQITLTGYQKNPYKYMRKIKLMVMPSRWEGFGLTAVEGMLLGCPVLGSAVGGLQDILLYENKNICYSNKSFVDRICFLLENPIKWEEESEKARKRAGDFCDLETYAQRIEKIYREQT